MQAKRPAPPLLESSCQLPVEAAVSFQEKQMQISHFGNQFWISSRQTQSVLPRSTVANM